MMVETQILMPDTIFSTVSLTPAVQMPVAHLVIPSEKRQLNLHEVLAQLVNTITLPLLLPEMLQLLTELIVQALEIDQCLIMLRGQANDVLRICTSHPDVRNSDIQVQNLRISVTQWEHLRTFSLQGQLPVLTDREAVLLNPLQTSSYQNFVCIPLCVGNEYLGLLYCYTRQRLCLSSDDQLLLNTIAQQTALAIKHRRYVEEDVVAQQNLVKVFIEDLLAGKPENEPSLQRRAYILGFDTAKPHVVALVELSEASEGPEDKRTAGQARMAHYHAAITRIKQGLQASYPGILIDEREASLFCLLPLERVGDVAWLNTQLEPLIQTIWQEYAVYMSVGIGACCQVIGDYPKSYAEAREAVQIGACFKTTLRCTHFAELGAYRYLYPFVQTQSPNDQYQDCIVAVLRYDQRKKANLLDTLEVYLECGGNIARTSCILEVHRNTLLQRLSRMQKLCPLDLEHMPYRLPLLMALKSYRLRAYQLRNDEPVDD
ncbi:helix-turn-helix domain-containing protein [Dictyobacter kobayashii]|uniref:GAF domain-containing protein n=1 Tax=Dictyobacter kobayashii TaxID=2014872 RepID=A0A402AX27_9CHLR|nr:helix-turn-helix domain-containing protein [Dictyobacter kobayashii]GCE23648.1 hypothetical protein KDK_74480 [Dictyobacter kobayashii]